MLPRTLNRLRASGASAAQRAIAMIVALCATVLMSGPETSAVPPAFTYQGVLKQAGAPVNGTYDLEFSLFAAPTGGTSLGTVPWPDATIVNGLLTAELDFGAAVFDGSERWLEIRVDGATLVPRQRITAAPYALFPQGGSFALPIDATGSSSDTLFKITNSNQGKAIAGHSTATGFVFPQPVGVYGQAVAENGRGVMGSATGPLGFGVFGISTGGPGVRGDSPGTGVHGEASADGGRGVFGKGPFFGTGYGGYFETTTGTGVRGEGTVGVHGGGSTDGVRGFGNNNGVYGEAFTSTGVGVQGKATEGTSVWGHSNFGYGVTGYCNNGSSSGVYGYSFNGYGGEFFSTWTTGVRATGAQYGVIGESNGGTGIYGAGGSYAGYFNGTVRTGRVGVFHDSPSFDLQLAFNSAAKPSSNVWTIVSDARLKKNIEPIEHALDDLLELRGVTYQWIDPASQGGMDGTYTGMIAQDVEKVFPEWIGEDRDGFKHLTVIGFEGLVVEALRDLRKEKNADIAALRAHSDSQVAALRAEKDSEIAELRNRIALLEKSLKEIIVNQSTGGH